MLDAKNVVMLTGGLTDTPETVNNGKIYKFRLGVDYAGNDRKNTDNKSGYFNVTYFLDDNNPNSKFVKSQVDAGNFDKGTPVQLVGRLVHERWETQDGKNASNVVIIAESITYAGRGGKPEGSGEGSSAPRATQSASSGGSTPMEF